MQERVVLKFIDSKLPSLDGNHSHDHHHYYYCQLLARQLNARKNIKAFSGKFEIVVEFLVIPKTTTNNFNHGSDDHHDDESKDPPNDSFLSHHHPIIEIHEIANNCKFIPVSMAYSKQHDLILVVDRNACFYFFQKEGQRFVNMFHEPQDWNYHLMSHHPMNMIVENCENGCDYVIVIFSNNIRKYNMKWYFNSNGTPRLVLIRKWFTSEKDIQKLTKQKTFFRPNAAIVIKTDNNHHNALHVTDGVNIHVFNSINGKLLRTLQVGVPLYSIDYLQETSEFVLLSDDNNIILYNETLQLITSTLSGEEENALNHTMSEQVIVDRASRNIIRIGSHFENAIIVISGVTRNPIHVYGRNMNHYNILPQCACMDEMSGEFIVADRRGRIIIFK
nr:unnamed protein product [Naegleria fowleri]